MKKKPIRQTDSKNTQITVAPDNQSKTAVVKNFLPKNRVAALSLLQQVKNAILRGGEQNSLEIKQFNANNDTSKDGWFHKLSQDEQKKALALNNVTVVLPAYTANYLLEAIHYIELGESPDKALGLQGKRARPTKRARDFELAQRVETYQTEHPDSTDTEALNELCKKPEGKDEYALDGKIYTRKAIDSSLAIGRKHIKFRNDIATSLGEETANHFAKRIIDT